MFIFSVTIRRWADQRSWNHQKIDRLRILKPAPNIRWEYFNGPLQQLLKIYDITGTTMPRCNLPKPLGVGMAL
ncbi:hypothetical protein [Fodinibius halophilus]|uniref:hypothetical protein n=1 Tax=Fodinibius halophilus TaxID=1736908 RepID=UPI00197AD3AE|nr:hypothetical protein [Fodinibius halophilus]